LPRIILTLVQAHDLQQDPKAWPGCWQFALDTPIPAEPVAFLDEARTATGLIMIAMDCSPEQIALQLNIKHGPALRQLYRRYEREHKKSR